MGHLLRRVLDITRRYGGIVDFVPSYVTSEEFAKSASITGSTCKRKLSASSSEIIVSLYVKRGRLQELDDEGDRDEKLILVSGKVSEFYSREMINGKTSRKKDDSLVSFKLWLYWLYVDLNHLLSLQQWREHVVDFQEMFLLVWWKKNIRKSFGSWLRKRLGRISLKQGRGERRLKHFQG